MSNFFVNAEFHNLHKIKELQWHVTSPTRAKRWRRKIFETFFFNLSWSLKAVLLNIRIACHMWSVCRRFYFYPKIRNFANSVIFFIQTLFVCVKKLARQKIWAVHPCFKDYNHVAAACRWFGGNIFSLFFLDSKMKLILLISNLINIKLLL